MNQNKDSQYARWKQAWSKDGWARPFLKQYRKALIASIVLGILTMVFAVGLMFTSGFLISDASEQPELGLFSLLLPLGLVQVFGLGKPFAGYAERLTSHDWVLHIVSSMRVKLFNTVESQNMFWLSQHRLGEMLGLLVEDIDHVQNLYLRVVFPQTIALLLWLGTSLFFGFYSPLFGLVIFLLLGVIALLVPLVAVLRNGALAQQRKHLINDFYSLATDDLIGIDDWRFADRKYDFLKRISEFDERIKVIHATLVSRERKRNVIIEVLFGLTTVLVLVWSASYFGSFPQADAGLGIPNRPLDWVAAFVIGFFPLLEAFSPLSDAMVSGSSHLDSIERLNALSIDVHPNTPQNAPSSFDIAASNINFQYKPEDALDACHTTVDCFSIRDISFSIPFGSKIALLGESGSGKTTLLSLIHGDRKPLSGSVTLGGIDTSDIALNMYAYIGYISQDTYIFNKTLYENLIMGNDAISESQVLDALHAVELDSMISSLPNGLHTLVDESGLRFSGGERQRIAIARILLQGCPIVMMDEPTVSLDPATEKKLLDTIFEVLHDRTIIFVTHHLLGIEHVDDIFFIKDGSISMHGTPSSLIEMNEYYRYLVDLDTQDNRIK